MNLAREDLFRLVWALPMVRVGTLLGVSGSAVLKACRKRGVPVPGRGHWAKVRHGQTPPVPELPTATEAHTPVVVREAFAATLAETLSRLTDGDFFSSERHRLAADDAPLGHPARSLSKTDVVSPQSAPAQAPVPRECLDKVPHVAKAVASQLNLGARPSLTMLISLARQQEDLRLVKQLVSEVIRVRSECDAAASGILSLWVLAAEETLAAADPVHAIVRACGVSAPSPQVTSRWWES